MCVLCGGRGVVVCGVCGVCVRGRGVCWGRVANGGVDVITLRIAPQTNLSHNIVASPPHLTSQTLTG